MSCDAGPGLGLRSACADTEKRERPELPEASEGSCSSAGAPVSSRDGRLARDWVSEYAPILAERYLPRR